MKFQILGAFPPGTPSSITPLAAWLPTGGVQFLIQWQATSTGPYPASVVASAQVSLRDAGGTALATYSATVNAHIPVVGTLIVDSLSSSISPGTVGTRPSPNSDTLSSGTGNAAQPAYEQLTSFNPGGVTAVFKLYSPGMLVVAPSGAYVTLDSWSITGTGWVSPGLSWNQREACRPAAAFTSTVSDFDVSVDASTSIPCNNRVGPILPGDPPVGAITDPDTSITYDWDWGDGSSHGSGSTATHSYSDSGTKTITLTVTDNYGGSDTRVATATIFDPTLQASVHDRAGNVFTAANSGTAVQVNQFPAGVSSKVVRASVSSAKNPTLARMPDGRLFLMTTSTSSGDAQVRVSHDHGRTFS